MCSRRPRQGVVELNWTDRFLQISPNNKALKFIRKRLVSDKYRGMHYSQHNRYDMEVVRKILSILSRHVPLNGLLAIRTTDTAKRPMLNEDEVAYGMFCDDVKASIGKGSQDSIRKTYFPDFHRMGLIYRYDNECSKISPIQKKPIKYVAIAPEGKRLIEANEGDANRIYRQCLAKMLEGVITSLLSMLRNEGLDYIDQHEYAFFVSAINPDLEFALNVTEAAAMIKHYRDLTLLQRECVIDALHKDLAPSMRNKRKPDRRDLHNWVNEAQQVCSLLPQTGLFKSLNNRLTLAGSGRAVKI